MRVSVETFGCATNQADSERIVGLLTEHGFSVGEGGDVVIVNTCTVKTPTERKIMKHLEELKACGRKVVVAGCLPAAEPDVASKFPCFSFIGVNTEDILAAVHAAASGRCFVRISEPREKFSLLRIRANPFVEIIPLAEGCLGSCTYCITRRARGALRSYPPEKIVERTVAAVLEGAREIWLTSQDSGAYGLDFGGSLPELLCGVLGVSGDFRVRVGMANPNHVIGFLDELLSAFADERVYRFLHVPVQSGNDRVLKDMGRAYSVDDFKAIVSAFRKKFDATISTDLIAGYPTEDESAFQDSVSLVKEVKPDILNVSRFWARPKTAAEKLKEFPGRETKRRSRILNQAFKEVGLLRNKKWVGWEGEALVSEKNQDGSYTARNSHYKPIILKSKENLLGKKVVAKITEATHFDLRGEVI